MELSYEEQVFLRLLMRDAWYDCDMRNKSEFRKKTIFKNSIKIISGANQMPKTKSTKEIREAAEQTYRWHKKIEKQLCGKKIKSVRYMTPSEAESSGWYYQPILLILDDGTALCPMSDDEGNEGSAMAVLNNEELSTIPVMRERI